jgi:hypothetical protein
MLKKKIFMYNAACTTTRGRTESVSRYEYQS